MCIFSHKFGKVEVDGFQYCSKCGEARKPESCNGHIWEKEKTCLIETGRGTKQELYVLKCKHCGLYRNYNTTTGLYDDR